MMAAPARGAVKGARSDAFLLVWVACFELAPGELRSVREIAEKIDPRRERIGGDERQWHWTVIRALRIAAEVKLMSAVELPPPAGRKRQVWSRHAWPAVVNVEWLIAKGARPTVARNVLLALETAGWLRADFRRAK